ncbi:ABC-2 type transport system ATP-binding protein/lipopolysaccharide transport system ATP-binding protein [Azospirillum brasilense]|uniref:ABC-2 type transport system ATP-binding protein/lipopolysaccharide transport system ATP-binding protein n=1 Tax=Azospirillum brasilense TaxID=192 RepID=A0A560BWX3_AZOBR|nr:ABC transporter ATP-binding protein [Azospirillum brasilense]MBK3734752.1 ATP-binding cassette domain-containing protein [Azospirillum brasilense]TWA77029.1 ABC-2 type transport system ATP-binding protein/lipopolysaccharide transport system ATP-binding protein [Azospirillum brasilense]
MAAIHLNDVSVDFVLYQGSARSLKKTLLRSSTSGVLKHDAHHRITVKALSNFSLTLEHGDRVGLIGGNGAGKTTLLRVLAGVYEPTAGRIRVEGRVTPLFDLGLGLDMDASGYDNIRMRAAYFGIDAEEVERKMDDIAAFTELGDYLNLPVRTYSAGMTLRLAFAAATSVDPEILLMDEWLAVSDTKFLEKAQRRAEGFVSRSSIMVVASHVEEVLKRLCNKVLWLERGSVQRFGPVDEVLAEYHAHVAAATATGAGA